jgi:hypothetical protein
MPSAQGTIKALHYLKNLTLADIEWNKPGLLKRVNINNLRTVKVPIPAEELA